MRNSKKLVQGIGFKGNDYPAYDGKKALKEYSLWSDMLFRCTEKCCIGFPTYIGVTCSDNFKYYSFFYEWCNKQVGFREKDKNGRAWHLDKDLLVKGNKVYSEDTCVFVPNRINNILSKRSTSYSKHPIGVYWCNRDKRFMSQCNNWSGKQKRLGSFNTPQEAFLAYKTFKEALIKEVANEYKDRLDPRAYQALINYEVNIND